MLKRRRRRGLTVLCVLALVTTAACGTRLPDSAFVNAGAEGTNAAAANRNGTSGGTSAAGTNSTQSSGGSAPGATGPGGGGNASGQTGGGGGADGPNQASDVGVTENEIVIGNITAVDGILGDAFAPPLRGLQAFVQYTNDHGGVHGRQLRLESCNDSEDRTKNLSCAQDLVENKHVFAFLANNSRSEGGSNPYVNQQGVPIF